MNAQDAQKKAKEEDKRKSAAAAAVAEAAARAKEHSKGGNKSKGEKAAPNPDPDGSELASTSNPLEEAAKLLVPLREHASGRLKTHTLSFEVGPSTQRT